MATVFSDSLDFSSGHFLFFCYPFRVIFEDFSDLIVRPISSEEKSRWIDLMDAHHYLGFRQLVGTYICYVALLKGQWGALLG